MSKDGSPGSEQPPTRDITGVEKEFLRWKTEKDNTVADELRQAQMRQLSPDEWEIWRQLESESEDEQSD